MKIFDSKIRIFHMKIKNTYYNPELELIMKNNKIFFRKHNFPLYHSPFFIREQETSARLVGRNFLEMWLYPPIAISTLMPQCNWWIKYRSKSRNIFKFEFWLYSYTLSSAYSHRYTKTTLQWRQSFLWQNSAFDIITSTWAKTPGKTLILTMWFNAYWNFY